MTVGQYRSAGITLTDAQVAKLQLDSAGNLKTVSAGTGATADKVQGNVASGTADAGNPVKIGGVYNSAAPTLTNGQRGDTQLDSAANVKVTLGGSAYQGAFEGSGSAVYLHGAGNPSTPGVLGILNSLWTGSANVLQRSNINTAALITAAGATTTQTGADQTNVNGRGLIVVLDMTTVGTGSVTITIQGKDAASGKYYTLLAGAAVVTNSTNVYTVYPGAPTTANVSAAFPLPATWRVLVTANNANATTYTVGASVIV